MKLKGQVEWALHCCSILSMLPEGRYLPSKHLAELHGVPQKYLAKAMQALSLAGITEGTLGPSGGYRLARPPTSITFLNVVEAVEGRTQTFSCTEIRQNNPCRPEGYKDTKPCAIARVMWDADSAWRNHLSSITLADLASTLQKDIAAPLLKQTANWVVIRS